MGTAGEFDATQLLAGIESKVTVSASAFSPLLIVLVLSVHEISALHCNFHRRAGGSGPRQSCLHPEAVVAFAAAPDLPYALALLKGAWAALCDRLCGKYRRCRARRDSDPRRDVEYDDHGVAHP